MESVVFLETPLAEFLKDEGVEEPSGWVSAGPASSASTPSTSSVSTFSDDPTPVTPYHQQQQRQQKQQKQHQHQQLHQQHHQRNPSGQQNGIDTPPPSPPSPSFAPMGRPLVRKRFRNKLPAPIRVDTRRARSASTYANATYPQIVPSTITRADTAQFIEQFRYIIITSNLLGSTGLGQHPSAPPSNDDNSNSATRQAEPAKSQYPAATGIVIAATSTAVLAWVISWRYTGGFTKTRIFFLLVLVAIVASVARFYYQKQWLQNIRHLVLSEVRTFVTRSQDFDSAASAAIAFIKEVELVSRGYRISAPLPPISRMDDKSQTRRCMRLRTAVRGFFADALPKYTEVATAVKAFSEQIDLEMYYHVYDISDFDVSDALQGFSIAEFDDPDSIRTLTVLGARFHTLRKMLLCAMLALEANGEPTDQVRWTTAIQGLHTLNETTLAGYERLRDILGEAETFPQTTTPLKAPLSPGRERWRSQLGKLNSLSTGIRGLQAKLALLREESDRSLNAADDLTELGPNLMAQYDSIGQDLKTLVQAWEEGKSALASGIDRNEKRLSSLSTSALMSPTLSLSGMATLGEDHVTTANKTPGGNAEDALRALTGGGGGSSEPEEEVVYEAVSLPPTTRPKSTLTREERIAKMKEERERRAEARERADANRGMLRELEMVINLRPKPKKTDKTDKAADKSTSPSRPLTKQPASHAPATAITA